MRGKLAWIPQRLPHNRKAKKKKKKWSGPTTLDYLTQGRGKFGTHYEGCGELKLCNFWVWIYIVIGAAGLHSKDDWFLLLITELFKLSYRFLSSHNGAIGKDKQNKNRSDRAGNALWLTWNHRLIHVKMGSCFARADFEHRNNHCPYVFSLTIYLSLIKVKQQRKCFSVGSHGTEMTAPAVSFKAAPWA